MTDKATDRMKYILDVRMLIGKIFTKTFSILSWKQLKILIYPQPLLTNDGKTEEQAFQKSTFATERKNNIRRFNL